MRKFTIIILLMFVLSSFGFAQNDPPLKINYVSSLDKAFEMAKKEKKNVFVDFYTDWCHWCKVYEKEVFSDQEVIKYLSEKFVIAKINGDMNRVATMKYNVSSYPHLVFLTSDNKELGRIKGYAPKDVFLKECEKVLSVLDLMKTVEENPDDIKASYSLGKIYFDQEKFEELIPLFNKVLDSKDEFISDKMEELYTKLGASYINTGDQDKGALFIEKSVNQFKEGEYREINVYNLVIMFARMNNKDKANVYLDIYEKDYPDGRFKDKISMIRMLLKKESM